MSIIHSIYDWLSTRPPMSDLGQSFTFDETLLRTPSATILSLPGGQTRSLFIGGGKEVDFLFRIVYKINTDTAASRAQVYEFFGSLTQSLEKDFVDNGDLGKGRKIIRCIQSSAPNKTGVSQSNEQEFAAEYTLTYQEF